MALIRTIEVVKKVFIVGGWFATGSHTQAHINQELPLLFLKLVESLHNLKIEVICIYCSHKNLIFWQQDATVAHIE